MIAADLAELCPALAYARDRHCDIRCYSEDEWYVSHLVVSRTWSVSGVIDVVIIQSLADTGAIGFRAPAQFDILSPQFVLEWSISFPTWAIRWLLTLAAPGPVVPGTLVRFPGEYGIPVDRRQPIELHRQLLEMR